MTAQYSRTSPYYNTERFGNYLDVYKNRSIPAMVSDILYQIDDVYNYRPDLLAFDLYGTPSLWWVFAVRNPNVIKDPVFDFRTGAVIYVPKKETIDSALGL